MTASTGDMPISDTSYRLSIDYESDYGNHSDCLYVQKQNLAAVIKTLPATISNDITLFYDGTSSDIKTYDYIKGKLFNNDSQLQTISVALADFIRHPGNNINIEPRFGRFYPATLYKKLGRKRAEF